MNLPRMGVQEVATGRSAMDHNRLPNGKRSEKKKEGWVSHQPSLRAWAEPERELVALRCDITGQLTGCSST